MSVTALERFLAVHGAQLKSSGIPELIWTKLFDKLNNSLFDAGNFFQFSNDPEQLVLSSHVAVAKSMIKAFSDIFLVDHAWSTTLPAARKKLQQADENSLRRIFELLQMQEEEEEEEEAEAEEEVLDVHEKGAGDKAEEKSADELFDLGRKSDVEFSLQHSSLRFVSSLRLSERLPQLEQLDLIGNEISDLEDVLESLKGLKDLRALWLKQNRVFEKFGASYAKQILQICPKLEILDTNFVEGNYTLWAIRLISDPSNRSDLDLTDRNLTHLRSDLLLPLSESLRTLDIRRNPLANLREAVLPALRSLSHLEHLWIDPSISGYDRKLIFDAVPHLCTLNGNDDAKSSVEFDREKEKRIDEAINRMWRYNQFYQMGNGDAGAAVWYIPDELGLAVAHSDSPNFKMVPFIYSPCTSSSISYSLLFPIRDVDEGEIVTRDFLPSQIRSPAMRQLRLAAFFPHLLDEEAFKKRYRRHSDGLRAQSEQYTTSTVKSPATFPPSQPLWNSPDDRPSPSNPVPVFCNIELVRAQFAKRAEFRIVTESTDAKILWLYEPLLSFLEIPESQILNQVPNEKCLTVKDLLVETVQRVCGRPKWLPPSYNLETELHEFVGDFLTRRESTNNNTWIVKPWNLARGIGHTVSSDLSCILRQLETGPKVACEYLSSPALYHHKKVDLRFMVAFKYASDSHTPELYVYQHFLTRFGNKNYSLDHFEDYEKHFTVMTFTEFKLIEVRDEEFIREFEKQYPHAKWTTEIQQRIYAVLRELFVAATAPSQTKGFRYRKNSFAVYGVDILIDSDMNAHLIEVNFAPNCARLQSYHDFFGDLFELLFFQRNPRDIWTRLL